MLFHVWIVKEEKQSTMSHAEVLENWERPSHTEDDPESLPVLALLGKSFSDVAAPPKSFSIAIAEEEVRRCNEIAPLALDEDPTCGKINKQVYPSLAKLAKRYLSIPGTSVLAEQVSTAGDIVTAQRSALTSEHVDQLLFLSKKADIHSLSTCH